MIKQKILIDLIQEIQNNLNKANLPCDVKVDIGKALEGADIGLKVYVDCKRNWKLHDHINSIIQEVLEKEDLIAFIDWHYKNNE